MSSRTEPDPRLLLYSTHILGLKRVKTGTDSKKKKKIVFLHSKRFCVLAKVGASLCGVGSPVPPAPRWGGEGRFDLSVSF